MKKNIAILFFGNYDYDARCINMAESLKKDGYFVDVFCCASKKSICSYKKIKVYPLPVFFRGKLRFLEWLCRLVWATRKSAYLKIIASDLYSLPVACLSKKTKVIYDSRDLFLELSSLVKSPIKRFLWGVLELWCLQYVHIVFASANSDIKYLKEKYFQYSHIKYYTLYNFPKIYSTMNYNYLREKFNIKDKNIILLYQGVLQPGRGISRLIKLIKKTKKMVGVIVGNGIKKEDYVALSQKLSVDGRIFFIDRLPYKELFKITASADVVYALIQPTSLNNRLALPNKLFEYALAGIPVLGSSVPNMKKYILRHNLGKTINYDNVEKQILYLENIKQKTEREKRTSTIALNKVLSWSSQEKKFLVVVSND